jgi:hypothetical protein
MVEGQKMEGKDRSTVKHAALFLIEIDCHEQLGDGFANGIE